MGIIAIICPQKDTVNLVIYYVVSQINNYLMYSEDERNIESMKKYNIAVLTYPTVIQRHDGSLIFLVISVYLCIILM
jgi:hypothetical protein